MTCFFALLISLIWCLFLPLWANETDDLAQAIMADISGSVKEFSRDVYVYHWGPREFITKGDELAKSDSPHALNFVGKSVLQTYDINPPSQAGMGNSYYAAANPRMTNYFGDTLIETRLAADMKYLDARRYMSFSHELRLKLMKVHCASTSPSDMFHPSADKTCLRIMTRFLQIYHISAVAYDYRRSEEKGGIYHDTGKISKSVCPNPTDQLAFILVNPVLSTSEHSQVFVPEHLPYDESILARVRINDIYSSTRTRDVNGRFKLWDSEQIGTSIQSSTEWAREHLFGCDVSRYPADLFFVRDAPNPTPDLNSTIPTWSKIPDDNIEPACIQNRAEDATAAARRLVKHWEEFVTGWQKVNTTKR